jgi:hypothetical protein
MAGQMSSREIEDVLSSIRRLVSEELKPSGRAAAPDLPLPARPQAEDKLVLTPALRVMAQQQGPAARLEPRLDAVVAALGAAVRPPAASAWESETGDPMPDRLGPGAAAVGGLRLHPAAAQPPAPQPAAARPSPAPAWNQPAPPEEEDAPEPAWAQDGAQDVLDYALEPGAAAAQPPVDPAWAEDAEAEVWAELAEDGPEDAPAEDGAETDAFLDEETLREMVRDMIREELAGPLGERITRNIRKLVHAEIARALTARDLS